MNPSVPSAEDFIYLHRQLTLELGSRTIMEGEDFGLWKVSARFRFSVVINGFEDIVFVYALS